MKDPTFIKNAVQEVAEKLKNWKDAGVRKEITPPKKKREEFPMQHDQESRTVSLLSDQRRKLPEWLESMEDSKSSTILTYWAVMTYLRSSSNSYYLKFKKA